MVSGRGRPLWRSRRGVRKTQAGYIGIQSIWWVIPLLSYVLHRSERGKIFRSIKDKWLVYQEENVREISWSRSKIYRRGYVKNIVIQRSKYIFQYCTFLWRVWRLCKLFIWRKWFWIAYLWSSSIRTRGRLQNKWLTFLTNKLYFCIMWISILYTWIGRSYSSLTDTHISYKQKNYFIKSGKSENKLLR